MKNKNKKVKALIGSIFFFFAVFSFSEKVEASLLINSEVVSNAWYILEDGVRVSCPSGLTSGVSSWDEQVNGVSVAVANTFNCVAPPWLANVSSEVSALGLVDGDILTYEFWTGSSLTGTNIGHIRGVVVGGVLDVSIQTIFSQFQNQTPVTGYINPTNEVVFETEYYANSQNEFDRLIFEIRDLSVGQNLVPLVSNTITQNSWSTFTATTTLTTDHQYFWRPVMTNTTTGFQVEGKWNLLYIINNTNGQTFDPSLVATTTPSAFSDFLNIGNLLSTKIPFAYVYQIGTLLLDLANSTTTAVAPIGQIPINLGHGTSTLTVFSTSTVTYFFSDSQISLLRGIMVLILYVGSGLLIWRMIHNIKL